MWQNRQDIVVALTDRLKEWPSVIWVSDGFFLPEGLARCKLSPPDWIKTEGFSRMSGPISVLSISFVGHCTSETGREMTRIAMVRAGNRLIMEEPEFWNLVRSLCSSDVFLSGSNLYFADPAELITLKAICA